MTGLLEYINEADKNGKAIGHFNTSNSEALSGIFNAARKLGLPIIIGVSEGERDFYGIKQIKAVVDSLRQEDNYPIFLNADHTYSYERVKEVVDAGYDAVIFDGSGLSLEENIKETKKCVEYAKSVNPNILVEGELGYIGKSSKILDELPEGVSLGEESIVSPEIAKKFVEETGVDLFAPAVGNIHGMFRHSANPALHIERIKEIRKSAGVPLVLHGGSGITDDDFKKAIKAGISVIHINTEIRVAFRDALKISLQNNPDEVAPYKIMAGSVLAVEKKVSERLKLFNDY